MKIVILLFFLVITNLTFGQKTDTLSFYSSVFGEERTVYVHKPEFYKYKLEEVKLPVIYLLDGQHEWFVNPILSDIRYLQYTHEIPNAIIVVIPLKNRIKECGIKDISTKLPLDIFITEELTKELERYHPADLKLIIGHSFSASFSLYSYYHHPDFYSGVIAHTPLDELELLVKGLEEMEKIQKEKIFISIGGIAEDKDYHHRKNYNLLKEKYPGFFGAISVFEADFSAHNAVPIVSTPMLLTRFFETFSSRYSGIAQVDHEYRLINTPEAPEIEIEKIISASKIDNHFYPPEIADINGIASRFAYSEWNDCATEVYKLGIRYYPKYYEFYLSLYELSFAGDREKSREYLEKAEFLLKSVEENLEGKSDLLEEIRAEKLKNGW